MKEVVVVKASSDQSLEYLVAREAALYLGRVIKSKMTIGVTWGRTMKRIVDAFDSDQIRMNLKVKGVEIVPMLGTTMPVTADGEDLRLTYSNLLSNKLAQLVNGISHNLSAPMYVRNLVAKDILMQEPQIQEVLNKARNCQLGIFGIGTLSDHSSIAALDKDKKQMILDMKEKGGVGEMIGRIYDQDGQPVTSEIDERLIGLTLDEIRKIPTRVGVAFGDEKREAIHVAMKTGIINVLVTDSTTAQQLVDKNDTSI
jgi:deoxyribonucleoside regulator